jgi:hypothetical protein
MKINIITNNNNYGFFIEKEGHVVFSSLKDHVLTSSVNQVYSNAWEACRDGRKFVNSNPLMILAENSYSSENEISFKDISTRENMKEEDFIRESYMGILEGLSKKIKEARGEEKDVVHQSLTSFIYEIGLLYENKESEGKHESAKVLAKLMEKYKNLLNKEFDGAMADIDISQLQNMLNPQEDEGGGGLPGLASSQKRIVIAEGKVLEKFIDANVARELVEDYACSICEAIQDFHQVTYDFETGSEHYYINIYDLCEEEQELILVARVNRHLLIDNIIPCGKLNKMYPLHSYTFYQRYFKPVIEKVGHYFVEDFDSVLITKPLSLPDVPKDESDYDMEGFDLLNNDYKTVSVCFKGKPMTWVFNEGKGSKIKTASSRYTEQDYAGALIQCVDKNQPSLFGEIGEVIQVIPQDEIIEIDVKFINLLDTDKVQVSKEEKDDIDVSGLIVRLTESQVIILDDEAINKLNLGV